MSACIAARAARAHFACARRTAYGAVLRCARVPRMRRHNARAAHRRAAIRAGALSQRARLACAYVSSFARARVWFLCARRAEHCRAQRTARRAVTSYRACGYFALCARAASHAACAADLRRAAQQRLGAWLLRARFAAPPRARVPRCGAPLSFSYILRCAPRAGSAHRARRFCAPLPFAQQPFIAARAGCVRAPYARAPALAQAHCTGNMLPRFCASAALI